VRIPLGQLDILKRYAWPGNIRELENVIERQVIVAQDQRLSFDDLLLDKPRADYPAPGTNELVPPVRDFRRC
jgi:transcriptional regulator with PAS, ATPase and Fis domain